MVSSFKVLRRRTDFLNIEIFSYSFEKTSRLKKLFGITFFWDTFFWDTFFRAHIFFGHHFNMSGKSVSDLYSGGMTGTPGA